MDGSRRPVVRRPGAPAWVAACLRPQAATWGIGALAALVIALHLPGAPASPREARWIAATGAGGPVPAEAALGWLVGRAFLALPIGAAETRLQLASLCLAAGALALLRGQLLAWLRQLPGGGLGPVPHARVSPWEQAHEQVAALGGCAFALVVPAGLRQWVAAGDAAVGAIVLLGGVRLLTAAALAQTRGLAAALVCGLAVGCEPAVAALLWPPALLATWRALRHGERWPTLAPALFACGTIVALPALRASASPGAALAGLVHTLTLGPAREAFASAERQSAGLLLAGIVEQAGVVALLLAGLGAGVVVARAPRVALWLAWGASVCLVRWAAALAAVVLAAEPGRPAALGAALRAGAPAAACLALLGALALAVGTARFAQALGRARLPAAIAVTVIALVVPLWSGLSWSARADARRLAWAERPVGGARAAAAGGPPAIRAAPAYGKIPRSR